MVSLGSGDNFNVPCETMETKHPNLHARSYSLRNGSAGAGEQRGGLGVAYDYQINVNGEFTVALDRDKFPPYGLFGGGEGVSGGLVVNPGSNREETFSRASGVKVPSGTVLSHRTAGGGGYGDPYKRAAHAVLEDVIDEYFSVEDARKLYGVVIDAETLALDASATDALRQART